MLIENVQNKRIGDIYNEMILSEKKSKAKPQKYGGAILRLYNWKDDTRKFINDTYIPLMNKGYKILADTINKIDFRKQLVSNVANINDIQIDFDDKQKIYTDIIEGPHRSRNYYDSIENEVLLYIGMTGRVDSDYVRFVVNEENKNIVLRNLPMRLSKMKKELISKYPEMAKVI